MPQRGGQRGAQQAQGASRPRIHCYKGNTVWISPPRGGSGQAAIAPAAQTHRGQKHDLTDAQATLHLRPAHPRTVRSSLTSPFLDSTKKAGAGPRGAPGGAAMAARVSDKGAIKDAARSVTSSFWGKE